MDKFFQYLPLIFQYGGRVKDIIDLASSNEDMAIKIKHELPLIAPLIEQYGAWLFPGAASVLHVVGGAIAAFDPNVTKWVQGACNSIAGAHIDVDGIYGPKTRDAVKLLQKKLGLKEDGLAGNLTRAALSMFELKLKLPATA